MSAMSLEEPGTALHLDDQMTSSSGRLLSQSQCWWGKKYNGRKSKYRTGFLLGTDPAPQGKKKREDRPLKNPDIFNIDLWYQLVGKQAIFQGNVEKNRDMSGKRAMRERGSGCSGNPRRAKMGPVESCGTKHNTTPSENIDLTWAW